MTDATAPDPDGAGPGEPSSGKPAAGLSEAGTAQTGSAETGTGKQDRVFLVVVDDSPERRVALRYACLRVRNGGGRVMLLRVVEPAEVVEWAGVGAMMQQEQREAAEALLASLAAEVREITGGLPILEVREGDPAEELLSLLSEDPRISILVLAAAENGGPGPLITALIGRSAARLAVPLTIVPGTLNDVALDRVT